jgi:predicted chitinase
MDQRDFAPEAASYLDNQPQEREGLMSTDPITGFEGMGPDPSTGQGIMSIPATTLTAEQRTAMSDMGSDVMRTNLHKITNARGNYSQTALTNAIDKGVKDETKRALLKGASQTEVGTAGPVEENRYSRGNINGLSRGRLAVGDTFEGRELTANDPMVGQFKHAWRRRMIRDGVMAEDGTLINYSGTNVFNSVYSNRNGNGDYASGDGDTYRGRGLIQITGKGTYQAVEDILKRDGINIDLVDNPDLALDTRYALPVAMAYLEYAGLDDEAAANSSAKDLNNRINPYEDAGVAERRWNNVVSNLSGDEATRMENRNEYAAQRTVGLRGGNVDGAVGNQTRPRLRAWLNERNITIPQNATDMDLVVLVNKTVNENS